MADILGNKDEHHRKEHRQYAEISLRGMESRQSEPRSLADRGKIDLAPETGNDIPDHHTEKDVQTPDKPFEKDRYKHH